jgi:hypothetical protein
MAGEDYSNKWFGSQLGRILTKKNAGNASMMAILRQEMKFGFWQDRYVKCLMSFGCSQG